MKEKEVEQIVKVLQVLGYEDAEYLDEGEGYKIFYSSPCREKYLPKKHENVVRALAEDSLSEFYWVSSIQFIFIKK